MEGIPILTGKYSVTMDLWPQQDELFNRIHPFYRHLREGRFTTTRCNGCGHVAFPPRVVCPECLGDDLAWVDLPTEGTVEIFTEEVVGVPLGFEPAPLLHALIALGDYRMFVRLINVEPGSLREGDTVRLAVFDVPAEPADVGREQVEFPRVFYAFEPAGGA
jgi:uncharacterized OB-fold protein